MVRKRAKQKNFWSDIEFVNEVRKIKHLKSANDNREYSDADITLMIIKDPLFQEIKKKLTGMGGIATQIKIQMDRKRGRLL